MVGGGGRRRRLGIQNQKQEPHTKLWGIKKSQVKVVELSGTNVDCESFGAVKSKEPGKRSRGVEMSEPTRHL